MVSSEFQVAHLHAGAQIGGVRRQGHVFHAARDDDVGVAVGDLLHAESDGAQARAAELVEAPGGLFLRNAGLHRGLAGRILALVGGEDLAEDDFIHFARRDIGARKGGLDGGGAQFGGGVLAESSAEGANRCAAAETITISVNIRVFLHTVVRPATDANPAGDFAASLTILAPARSRRMASHFILFWL